MKISNLKAVSGPDNFLSLKILDHCPLIGFLPFIQKNLKKIVLSAILANNCPRAPFCHRDAAAYFLTSAKENDLVSTLCIFGNFKFAFV